MTRWKTQTFVTAALCAVLCALSLASAHAADQRIQFTEQMVGAGHPTSADTLNRLTRVEHNTDGTHKYLPELDVRKYGAACDGTTNDTAAFQAAHDALPNTSTKSGGVIRAVGICIVKNLLLTTPGTRLSGYGGGYVAGKLGATVLQAPNGVGASDAVVKINSGYGHNIWIEHLTIYPVAPNTTDKAGRGILSYGTRPILDDVVVFAATVLNVDFTGTDSADGGGIFRSAFYSGGSSGTIRLSGQAINVESSYINCNGSATAISVRGIAPTSASAVHTRGLLIETCATPVVDVGDASTGGVASYTDDGSRITNVSGSGNIIQLGDTTNGGNFSLIGTEINGGSGVQARAISVASVSGNVTIAPAKITGTYRGGTGAAILAPLGLYGEWDVRSVAGVEYNGYKGTALLWHYIGTHASAYPLGQGRMSGVTLTTSGATPTAIFAPATLQNDMLTTIRASVSAKRPDASAVTGGFFYERQAAFLRTAAGTSSQVGSTAAVVTIETDAAANCDIALATNDAQVQATGVAATNYNWVGDFEWTVR